MNTTNNTPTVVMERKNAPISMSEKESEPKQKCKFCGEDGGIGLVAIMPNDSGAAEELDPKKIMWLCDGHYVKISQSSEYRVREIPGDAFELGHSSREEVSEGRDSYVTILEPKNENKWLQVPEELETNLNEET